MLEQELKLTANNPSILEQVLVSDIVQDHCIDAVVIPPKQFLAIYYDVKELALEAKRCSLRARREGERFVAAFKLAGTIVNGLSEREEYEADINDWLSMADDLPEGDLKQRVASVISLQAALLPQVQVDMQRQIRNLQVDKNKIELVADQGVISGAQGKQSLYEIELELKQGDPDVLMHLGNQLQAQFSLRPSTETKHQIGLALREFYDVK